MSAVISSSVLNTTSAVLLMLSLVGFVILLIVAVVGVGEDGNTFSPTSALANDDFPELKPPKEQV